MISFLLCHLLIQAFMGAPNIPQPLLFSRVQARADTVYLNLTKELPDIPWDTVKQGVLIVQHFCIKNPYNSPIMLQKIQGADGGFLVHSPKDNVLIPPQQSFYFSITYRTVGRSGPHSRLFSIKFLSFTRDKPVEKMRTFRFFGYVST